MREELKISRTLQLVFGVITLLFLTFFDDSAGKSLISLILVNIWFFYYIRLLFRILDTNFCSELDKLGSFTKIINSLFLLDILNDSKKTKTVKIVISLALIIFIIVATLTLKAHESRLIVWIPVSIGITLLVSLTGRGSQASTSEDGSYTDAFLCVSCGSDYMNSSGYCDSCSKSRT